MRLLYGSPLPPGLEAPTRGELRIRIEKLLLKDELVSTGVSSDVPSQGSRLYPIPIDHCAVSPLFWGEQHPTCRCVPATPGKLRGAVSLVYPLKTYEPQFREYLSHMSNSEHRGVHFSVFVPNSYSGRHRSVPVGKSIVALNTLKPSSPVSGWFPIMSDGALVASTIEDGEKNLNASSVEVGRLKMTFTLNFFARAPVPPARQPSHGTQKVSHDQSAGDEKIESAEVVQDGGRSEQELRSVQSLPLVSPEAGVAAAAAASHRQLPRQQQEMQHRLLQSGGCITKSELGKSSMSHEDAEPAAGAAARQLPPSFPPAATSVEINQNKVIDELLQQGISLREKMARVLSHSTGFDDLTPSPNFLSSQPVLSMLGGPPGHSPSLADVAQLDVGAVCNLNDSSQGSFSSASVETVVSEEDELGNDVGPVTPGAAAAAAAAGGERSGALCSVSTGRRAFRLPFQSPGVFQNGDTYVEVDLSRIAFSSGRATLGMEEMRVGIRLSKDVKTDEPVESYSSYVHRVPLVRGAEHHIVIGFSVRSFSEDSSRMVISFYRVRSAPVPNPPGEVLLPVPASAQRVLVEETLLGMCIVGLHNQFRNIVLHDPITGEDPAQAQLRVSIRSSSLPLSQDNLQDGLPAKEREANKSDLGIEGAENGVLLPNTKKCNGPIEKQQGNPAATSPTRHSHGRQCNVVGRGSSPSSASSSSPSSPPSSSSTGELPPRVKGSAAADKPTATGTSGCGGAVPESRYVHEQCSSKFPTVPTQSTVTAKAAASHRVHDASTLKTGSSMAANSVDSHGDEKTAHGANATTLTTASVDRALTKAIQERFRMHVSIRAGKELPMVAISEEGPTLRSLVAAVDQLENGVRSAVTADGRLVLLDSKHRVFKAPTTFFVVEDVLNGADSRAAAKGIVPDWFVEAAVRGKYDRTLIVPESQSPQYDYESILSLPKEAVFLRHEGENRNATLQESSTLFPLNDNTSSAPSSSFCLRELRLTLWHAVDDTSTPSASEWKDDEERFWAHTAILGECRVELRSLRFLKLLDGWYRINAIGRADEVVGYVRVSVRLL
ncbi:uncharacterized protein Tco025E_06285 [Trypanosoma conorhini]|uniref:C2CD3 N-terminal C2 domain-containing protein n=1 Tax=Trypanosoma conorhini TaxID=83891 RepID=A0A422P685_9TRYP|nr:uncharacterized protein Tco025E_06285 [Trypanosoma conorhini]RNF13220.1 hypothetical protein Tco025E_06285 [Trypanosoma conorhini]